MPGESLREAKFQKGKLSTRCGRPASEATADRYGRKVLAYPVMTGRIARTRHSSKIFILNPRARSSDGPF